MERVYAPRKAGSQSRGGVRSCYPNRGLKTEGELRKDGMTRVVGFHDCLVGSVRGLGRTWKRGAVGMPISADVLVGKNVTIHHPELVNLYGCRIGDDSRIGAFVEIQKGAIVGKRCKISSHAFICEGVTIEDDVFVGHGVVFINDRHPRASVGGRLQTEEDWTVIPVRVRRGASIGSNATILCGVTIGQDAMVGAGAVVTRDVPDYALVVGAPARVVADVRRKEISG